MEWCGGSKVLATLLSVNVLLSLMLMAACALSGITGVPAGRIVEIFTLSSDISIFITRPWTLATYMVVQLSFLHLLFNMLWLYWFGKFFLDGWPERRLLWAYIGGGLSGGVIYLAS